MQTDHSSIGTSSVRTCSSPVGIDVLLLAGAAEHERAGIDRVGQQLVDRAIARADPSHPSLTDRPAREQLPVGDQLADDLPGGAGAAPDLEHALDRVPDLLVSAQDDPVVLVALEPGRQMHHELAARGLVPQPASQPRADQVQLRLGHRALQPEQQPVVEITRRVDPVRVGDQRPGQRAQIDQLMPVRRGAREPRDLQREDQPDVPQADVGDQLLEPHRPCVLAPDRPVSSSTTVTDAAGQPSATARSRSAYCRAVDSVLRSSCPARTAAHRPPRDAADDAR